MTALARWLFEMEVLAQVFWGPVTVGPPEAPARLSWGQAPQAAFSWEQVQLGTGAAVKDALSQAVPGSWRPLCVSPVLHQVEANGAGLSAPAGENLEVGSWAPGSHRVPTGSGSLYHSFHSAHAVVHHTATTSVIFGKHRRGWFNPSPRALHCLQGMKFKRFGLVFHNLP